MPKTSEEIERKQMENNWHNRFVPTIISKRRNQSYISVTVFFFKKKYKGHVIKDNPTNQKSFCKQFHVTMDLCLRHQTMPKDSILT